MTNSSKAYLLASIAVLFWSTISTAFKLSLRETDPVELLFFSVPVAVAVLCGAIIMQKKTRLLLQTSKREILSSLLLGLLNPFVFYIVLLNGYDRLLTQEAMAINFTWPIVLVFLSAAILKQRLSMTSIAALLLGFAGTCIIVTRGSLTTLRFTNPLGVLLMTASTILWSLFWIFNQKDGRDPAVKLLLNFACSLPCITAAWLLFRKPHLPPVTVLAGAAYIGIFEMGVTFLLWLEALSFARDNAQVANIIYAAPFLALVWIRLFLHEPIAPSTVIGLVCITAGIVLQKKAHNRRVL